MKWFDKRPAYMTTVRLWQQCFEESMNEIKTQAKKRPCQSFPSQHKYTREGKKTYTQTLFNYIYNTHNLPKKKMVFLLWITQLYTISYGTLVVINKTSPLIVLLVGLCV